MCKNHHHQQQQHQQQHQQQQKQHDKQQSRCREGDPPAGVEAFGKRGQVWPAGPGLDRRRAARYLAKRCLRHA